MIYYLTTQYHQYTMKQYLENWGINLVPRIRLLTYEKLDKLKSLPLGTYIFSDIERLTPEQAERVAKVWEKLASAVSGVRLLNHPTRSMKRYELLRTLYERGLNQFNVYHLTELRKPERFPVFLRGENDHDGSQTALIKSPDELDAAIDLFYQQGKSRCDKIITELCNTSDEEGVFRKYAAFKIGDRIIPRGMLSSHQWMVKVNTSDFTSKQTLCEEQEYILTNPHELELREIFQLANIEYGRIDYSMLNGKPQIWEINTNSGGLTADINERLEQLLGLSVSEFFSKQFELAFEAIDCRSTLTTKVEIWATPKTPTTQKVLKQSLIELIHKILRLLKHALLLMPDWIQVSVFKKFIALKKSF